MARLRAYPHDRDDPHDRDVFAGRNGRWICVVIEVRDTSTPVVILQFSAHDLLHGGLCIARTMGRLGVRVYWVHSEAWAPAALSRYIQRRFFWDVDAPAEALVERLLEYGRQIGHRPILVPIDDMAATFVEEQADTLKERFLFPDQPLGLTRTLADKKEMHFLCKKTGVPTPEASFPESRDDVAEFVRTATFPVVLKRIAWLPEHREQTKSVAIVDDPEELSREYAEMEAPDEPNVMLQEYIPGGPESVWMFNGYFTGRSECLAGFTGKKIRQAPPFTGATTLGICLKNETVEEMTIEFMRKIGYSGIVDMGYRYDRRDGQYKLLDVNPRIGATFRLFVDAMGMDVVRALYLDLTGQSVPRGVPREGRKWMVEQSDLMSSLQYIHMGRLTPTEWARSFRGIEEGAWFALDDPLPFAAMGLTSFAKAGRKLKARVRAARAPEKSSQRGDMGLPDADHQQRVDSHFDSVSSYWAEIYNTRSVEGVIYQHRQAMVHKWIEELGLATGSRILEVGCGAGLTTVELARCGYVVDGVDSSEAMVELALRNASESRVEQRVNVMRGDVRSLPFENELFNLVLAIGVIPWLESPDAAMREMARLTKPGGYVILTSDNRARLNYFIDPKCNPALGSARQLLKEVLENARLRGPRSSSVRAYLHSISYIDRMVRQNHLEKVKAVTLGFGPFSFMSHILLPEPAGIRLHRRLQALADRGVAGIRSSGSQYLILARKPQNLQPRLAGLNISEDQDRPD